MATNLQTAPVLRGLPADLSLCERLERGEVIFYPESPFALPQSADLDFLLEQTLASHAHKNIGYDPHTEKASGYRLVSRGQADRLRGLLAKFSETTTAWLRGVLPSYAGAWQLDRVSYRPEEEATRHLRLTARNDLLHVDAFPSRPTNGWRILRVFANVNPVDSRIWMTSEPFGRLLERYGASVGLPVGQGPGWVRHVSEGIMRWVRPRRARRSAYDAFMLRFHNFLKANEDFQEHCPKRFWTFPPGSAWMVITDTATHAALRGRYALEHSYFISPDSLALSAESPAALLEKACGARVLNRAA